LSFTDPAETVRRKSIVRFKTNSTDVTTRHLDDDYISLTEGDDAATSSTRSTETILSNEAGEKL
jgi:hypothetical protein